MAFLDLGIEDSVPDATTVWSFREELIKASLIGEIFERFNSYLKRKGYEAKIGQIIDATLVPVPKQRNLREENKKLKVRRDSRGVGERAKPSVPEGL